MKFFLPPHIPVRVTLGFWITAAIIGLLLSGSPIGMLIWTLIIFVSILVHEYGHALASTHYGQHPRIELIPFGGVTYPEGKKVAGWQEFIVVFCGPLFGLGLALVAALLVTIPAIANSSAGPFLILFRNINIFWTIVNLLPVLPLDGGQLLRIVCQSFSHENGLKITFIASLIISVVFCIVSFLVGYFLIGAIFMLFAFQNFELFRRMRSMTLMDQDEENQSLYQEIERDLEQEQTSVAKPKLLALIKKTKRGLIYNASAQSLARLYIEENRIQDAYALLKPIRRDLTDESTALLHRVAFEVGDDHLTLEIAGPCFQATQDPLVALRSAKAAARSKLYKPMIGWLMAARREGLPYFEEALDDPIFTPYRARIQKELNP